MIVARGSAPGKRITLTSGVHGDEMSSIRTVQMVMDELDPANMAGSVMAVLDIARPALEGMQRRWPNQGRGIDLVDMNREWPGNENGTTSSSRHAGLLFNRLLRPNSDIAIDFHTGTTGLDCNDWIIGNRQIPEVKTMIDLFPVRQVWDSPAYPGVLHNAFTDAGIPSICPEVGAARILDPTLIAPFVEGTMNVLKHYGVIGGSIGRTAAESGAVKEIRSSLSLRPRVVSSNTLWSSTKRSPPARRLSFSATPSAKWWRNTPVPLMARWGRSAATPAASREIF